MTRYPLKELGDFYMDAKISGGAWQCSWDDGSCQEMEAEIDFAEKDNSERSNDFKYVFDVSWRSRCVLLSSSTSSPVSIVIVNAGKWIRLC